jgi:hypothetical protein
MGGDTDDDDGCRFMEEKSADDDDAGRGVPTERDLGVRRGPTHCRM